MFRTLAALPPPSGKGQHVKSHALISLVRAIVPTYQSQADLSYRRGFLCSYESPKSKSEVYHAGRWGLRTSFDDCSSPRLYHWPHRWSVLFRAAFLLSPRCLFFMRVQHTKHTTPCGLLWITPPATEMDPAKTGCQIQEYNLHTVSRRHSNLRECSNEKNTSALLVWY